MVNDPTKYLDYFKSLNVEYVIFPLEIGNTLNIIEKVKEYNFNKKKTNTPAPNKTQEKEPAKEVKKDYPFQHKSSTHKKKELPFYLRQDNKK